MEGGVFYMKNTKYSNKSNVTDIFIFQVGNPNWKSAVKCWPWTRENIQFTLSSLRIHLRLLQVR